ncbi:hypothetical protein C3I27_03700 [Campylobacter jejuni]|uniref:Uncharacterized protein n=2 Tax=Campylobacter jejuni TaxID=197 RepID=A0AAX1Z4Q6_CAMJU|nr:hypothetical protein C3I27_03700 [Campylobacter jejuni]
MSVPYIEPTTLDDKRRFQGHLFMLVKTKLEQDYTELDMMEDRDEDKQSGATPDYSTYFKGKEREALNAGLEPIVKALFNIPTKLKAGGYTKKYLQYVDTILHLYWSTKRANNSKGSVYGFTPAFCKSYYKDMSSARRSVVLAVKNCDKITVRGSLAYEDRNDPAKSQAERVKMTSAMCTKITKLINAYHRAENKCSADKVNPEFKEVLDRFESTKANIELLKSKRILTVTEDYYTSTVLTRQPDLFKETYGWAYSLSEHFPMLNLREPYFWRTGRYNSSNFHAGLPKEIKAYVYQGHYNYDMSDAHVQVLRNILAYVRDNSSEYSRLASETIQLIDIDLNTGKEAIANQLGVEVSEYKKMKYTLLNGGNLHKGLCPTRMELFYKYGKDETKAIINRFDKLEIARAFESVPELIRAYHDLMSHKEYRNNITNHETYEDSEEGLTLKRLTAYYLQGGESEFIYRLMRECMNSGIKVVAYEYDGIVTDKVIPDSLVDKVNCDMSATYPYCIKNKPFM